MAGSTSYTAITTKIRAMESRLLSDEDFRDLSASASLTDAVLFLRKNPSYRVLFADLEESTIRRGEVEQRLNDAIFYDFQKIYYFANQKQRKMVLMLSGRYVPVFLKSCVNKILIEQYENKQLESFSLHGNNLSTDTSIHYTNSPDDPAAQPLISTRNLYNHPFFEKSAKLDVAHLRSCKTIDSLIVALQGTGYDVALKTIRDSSDQSASQYEYAIDMYYFSRLWKKREDNFEGINLEVLEHSIGSQLDLLNIEWIYRCKKYFLSTPAEINALIIPIHYQLRKRELSQMIDAGSLEEFAAVLRTTRYGRKYQKIVSDHLAPGDIERMQHRILDKIYFSDSKSYPHSIAVINSFIHRKETEISKIVIALEGVRYSLNANEIIELISN